MLSSPSSLSVFSRRRSFILSGKSTFVTNEQNTTDVAMVVTKKLNISSGESVRNPDNISDAEPQYSPTFEPRRNLMHPKDVALNDFQLDVLRHRIPKFTIPIESVNVDSQTSRRFIILWRSLVDDSPELAGFPISFLVEQAKSMNTEPSLTNETLPTKIDEMVVEIERVLPYIDAYQFESGGGLSGLVYGIAGVSDGTRIRTTPVGDVQTTLPRNFVQTADGCVYELGRPSFVEDSHLKSYSLSGASKRWYLDGSEIASSMVAKTTDADNFPFIPLDTDIVQLSALTALVLGGSYVLGTLSHHLTVNVFWV